MVIHPLVGYGRGKDLGVFSYDEQLDVELACMFLMEAWKEVAGHGQVPFLSSPKVIIDTTSRSTTGPLCQ